MHRSLRRRLLLAALVAALTPFFVNLGGATIWDANEAYYVETPREMLESGDYINPSFNYEPRFNKPVLSYWLVAGLYHVLGVSVATERLAIVAAALVMIVVAFVLGRAASGDIDGGIMAALGLALGPRFFMVAVLGGIDALVFTAGVGENSPEIREAACRAFSFLGLKLDSPANLQASSDSDIAAADSSIPILVIRAQEEWAIARECWKLAFRHSQERST